MYLGFKGSHVLHDSAIGHDCDIGCAMYDTGHK